MHALCLLSGSFVSQRLLDTLRKYHVPVFAEPGLRKSLPADLLYVNEAQAEALLADASTRVYASSEDSLPFLLAHAQPALAAGIRAFKDKTRCRHLLASAFPEYFFTELKRKDLPAFSFPKGKILLVKPSIGFHSLGIRRVSSQAEWDAAIPAILVEIERYRKTFSEEVVSADRFLVEDFIDGEEYACDAFFDAQGEPQVTGLYHHPFASADDARDVVYYTSPALLRKLLGPVTAFLRTLGTHIRLASFPVHFEFRLSKASEICLIEVNPLRFGGFGLADLPRHAFGVDAYECFLLGKGPDWPALLSRPDAASYAFVLGQAPEKLSPTQAPDHAKFRRTFRDILDYLPVDHTRYKFFATVYTKTEDKNELFKYLHFDFGEYAGG